ncbi:LuxR C-terminal-related transcriptional regulator [Bradyrhizobium barranii]|jgi:DNA-binding CsgD family transcriptional regulator|uniref:helix-turn-helix transcriptional regulator n=1 Tax=Bradyrhizobium TaxID=374 RepID=UPI0033923A37
MTVTALTRKQKQVCELVAEELSNKEIGVRLGIGHRTVEFHRAQVYRRLGVRDAVELVRKVLEGKTA